MKYNKHYAGRMSDPGMPPNGLRPDQAAKEGSDQFIQEDRYFSTYANYFVRFIQDYRSQDIDIGMVMPQNEFNSAQPFPSCCWTHRRTRQIYLIPRTGDPEAACGRFLRNYGTSQ